MVNVLRLFHRLVVLAFGLCCITAAHAYPYSALYAFGDSLSDVGNDLIISGNKVPAPSIYTDGTNIGRFTNGLNYLDRLSSHLGLGPLAPSLAGGTDYAYGGARTTYAGQGLPAQASFVNQIAAFDATHPTPGTADPNALYVLWIGANDMADAISAAAFAASQSNNPFPILAAAIINALTSIAGAITNLAGLGATHFLVPNLPDLSLTPLIGGFGSAGLSFLANSASVAFNTNLANTLDLFPSLDIRDLDVFGFLNAIVADPAGNGFANVKDSCYKGDVDGSDLGSGTSICATPDQYVFWDFEHPSAATHAILAQRAFVAAVPEPSAIWVLVFAMGGLASFARRRQLRAPEPVPS